MNRNIHKHIHLLSCVPSFMSRFSDTRGFIFTKVPYSYCLVAKSSHILWTLIGCPPVSSVHGISQARILEWVAISFSRGSSRPRDRTCISCIAGRFFTTEPPGESKMHGRDSCRKCNILSQKITSAMITQSHIA